MMDVTSCGSMAGSACAAFRAVDPCIYIYTYTHIYIYMSVARLHQCGQRPRRDGHRTLKI